jgi:aminopeptidase YwaD
MEGKRIAAAANTYSPSCDVEAELVAVSSSGDLPPAELTDKIAVVHGEITRTRFLPRNFPRRDHAYTEQDRLLALLESGKPLAILTVNHRKGPLPVVLSDSDLPIPSATLAKADGDFLIQNSGRTARLILISDTTESSGANVIARRPGTAGKKIIFCAHYDTVPDTPGALSNASGVTALLLAAWYLKEVQTELELEFVAFGGKDSWWPGDALYIEKFPPKNVVAVINIDGIGIKDLSTAIAFYKFPDPLMAEVLSVAGQIGDYVIEQSSGGNHDLFWPMGVPTLALATSSEINLAGQLLNTENDTLEFLDNQKIEQTARLLHEIVLLLDWKTVP